MQGLELSRRFYFEAVRPILERDFPDFEHAAALIGFGSDVLGYDDETSRDHEWGPRVFLFARDADDKAEIEERLAHELPTAVAGFPTHFGATDEPGTTRITATKTRPVTHRARILVLGEYLYERIGVDPLVRFTVRDWLTTPSQRLLELTAGEVFVDPIGQLTQVRALLGWYPDDVWRYVLAGHWRRIAQLEHFLGRTGSRGDELGSRVVAASLTRDLMRIALLQERRYPPYAKWLGSAFAELGRPETAALDRALAATDWRTREEALVEAYEAVAQRHNQLELTEPVEPTVRPFWGREFRVLFADRFVAALRAAISGEQLRALDHDAGAIDALSDNVDLLTRPSLWRPLADLYDRT